MIMNEQLHPSQLVKSQLESQDKTLFNLYDSTVRPDYPYFKNLFLNPCQSAAELHERQKAGQIFSRILQDQGPQYLKSLQAKLKRTCLFSKFLAIWDQIDGTTSFILKSLVSNTEIMISLLRDPVLKQALRAEESLFYQAFKALDDEVFDQVRTIIKNSFDLGRKDPKIRAGVNRELDYAHY